MSVLNGEARSADVVVVGGGPASLYMAHRIALLCPALAVTVLERATAQDRQRRGVLVHPLSQALLETALPRGEWQWGGKVHRLREFHGDVLRSDLDAGATTERGQARYPSNTSLDVLSDGILATIGSMDNVTVRFATVVESAERTSTGWVLRVSAPAGDTTLNCAVLIAADGRESQLREAVGIPFEEVQFPGRVDILALAERRSSDPSVSMVVGDDGATTIVDNGIGPNTLIFDMRPDGAAPVAPTIVREQIRSRSMLAGLALREDVRPLFTTSIRSATVACGTWLADRALVFGDAAHAMHNLGGQGFNLAVQNAAAIAPHVQELVEGDDSSIRDFEAYRLPYIAGLQRRQNELFDLLAQGRNDALGEGWFRPIHRNLTLGQDGLEKFIWQERLVSEHA